MKATIRTSSVVLAIGFAVLLEPAALAAIPGGSLDPHSIPKYQAPLVVPPAMPRVKKLNLPGGKSVDVYEIAVRQFEQQILPPGMPKTTVWGYGSVTMPGTVAEGGSFHAPSFTIEAKWRTPVRVRWINDLVDAEGNYLPHLLPVDQTVHWANPTGDCRHPSPSGRDCAGRDPEPYRGPVPIVVHVHGAETYEWADGFPEAWFLPAARNLPDGIYTTGSFYDTFRSSSPLGSSWQPGSVVFEYPNDQRATTLWYHDHALGITRLNVIAGPAGFYLLRGGPDDKVLDRKGKPAVLPGPAPALGDPPGTAYYEIPIAIQDRSFNEDGSLFYPTNRAFFEGLAPEQLQIPFIPQDAIYPDGTNLGPSDVNPIWNPEFFGNTMVVNGRTWPYLEVEQRRYRFRLLNGCSSRFLILRIEGGLPFWQIGAEGGFLPAPVRLEELLLGPAERADVIVDFSSVPAGTRLRLLNLGPDEPFSGGRPGVDFEPADPATTGQVLEFRVVRAKGRDNTTPPSELVLPPIVPLGAASAVRRLSLNEEESRTVRVETTEHGDVVLALDGEPFGPVAALLGTLDADGFSNPLGWAQGVTENPAVGATETWEIYNFTADAHPIHIHLVQFQVLDRQALLTDEDGMAVEPAQLVGDPRPPEPWETGFKDTVIAYPGEVTRVKAAFDFAGLYVWHCHILEHEDNEMMRPYCVGDSPACRQAGMTPAPMP